MPLVVAVSSLRASSGCLCSAALSPVWLCPQEPSNFLEQKCLRLKAAQSVFTKRYLEWKCKSARTDLMYI